MAIIMGQKEQQAALKEIESARKEIEKSNTFLECDNVKGTYSILFTAEDGTRCKAVAYAEKKAEIDRLVLHHKQLVSERVLKLAEDNRILLNAEEKSIFGLPLSKEEQEELDALALAELEAAEQAAAAAEAASDAPEFPEDAGEPDKPFYDPDSTPN